MLALALVLAVAPPADLGLVGVVLSKDGQRSQALLRAEGRVRVAAVGEAAFGGHVVSIGPTGVVLAFGEERVELRLPGSVAAPAAVSPAPASATPGGPTDDRALSLPRQQVQARLGNEIPRILAETALVPFYEDGRITGLSVKRMPDGTLLSEVGLRPGDVIREINGTVIDGMATLIGLWTRLQSESSLRAIVQREGRLTTLTLTLK